MKFLPLGLLALISSFCIYSCSKKGGDKTSPTKYELSSDKTSLTLKVEGGNESFNVSSNTSWELTGLPAWLKATPTKGTSGTTKVELVYDPNVSANELKTTITLKADGIDPFKVSVTQLQPEVTISNFTEHGKGGAQLIITGTGFSEVLTENTVTVNELAGIVTAATKTSLTVTIPAKAGDGKVRVRTNTRTQTSTTDFYYDWIGVVSTFNYNPGPYAIPNDIVFDAQGNMYISDSQRRQIYKVSTGGALSVFAGSGDPGMDDGPAADATFGSPKNMAIDASGNIFLIDQSNACIRKITPAGAVTRIAGHNTRFGTVDGDVSVASFQNPEGIAVDKNGIVYISEYFAGKVRKIEGSTVSTFAGSGAAGDQDGTGADAQLNVPQGLRLDADGNILLAATYNNKIKKITPAGVVTTLAGSQNGFTDGPVASAKFWFPRGIGADANGNIVVADRDNHSIRYISKKGWVSTLGGTNTDAAFVDGTGSAARFCLPENVNFAPNGDVWVVDGCEGKIRKIVLQ